MESSRQLADGPPNPSESAATVPAAGTAGSPEPAAAAPQKNAVAEYARQGVAGAVAMTRYYAAHAGDLWQHFVEVAPFLEAVGDREREIRISATDGIGTESFDGQSWRVTFPDCCAVTGDAASGEWIEETRDLPDMTWPFWGAVGGVCGGLLLMWIFWSYWLLPIGIVVGLIVGYVNRRTRRVTLRFRRSTAVRNAAARGEATYPQARVFPQALLIRLGSSAARKAFIQERITRETIQRGGAGGGVISSSGPAGSDRIVIDPAPARSAGSETQPGDAAERTPPNAASSPSAGRAAPPPLSRPDLPPISLDE